MYSAAGMATIGRRNTLRVVRDAAPGLYLDGGETGEILLPGRYIPRGIKPGDRLDVFVYLDSEDRLVATTETPHAMVGEFAYLQAVSVVPKIGTFLDWGLSKDLLLPFTEQTTPVRTGQWVTVGILLDPVSHRIVATTRLGRHLNRQPPTYTEGQPVQVLVTAQSPRGYHAIIEPAHRGILYHTTRAAPLAIGQRIHARVGKVRTDGIIELISAAAGHQPVAPLTDKILLALQANQGRLAFDDATSPEVIREQFGVSKNAFKLALGALYKQRRIRFLHPGIELTVPPTAATTRR